MAAFCFAVSSAAVENAEQVSGYYMEAKMGAIDDIKEQCKKLDELGLDMFNEKQSD